MVTSGAPLITGVLVAAALLAATLPRERHVAAWRLARADRRITRSREQLGVLARHPAMRVARGEPMPSHERAYLTGREEAEFARMAEELRVIGWGSRR